MHPKLKESGAIELEVKMKKIGVILLAACMLLFNNISVNAASGNSYDDVNKIYTEDMFKQSELGYYVYLDRKSVV